MAEFQAGTAFVQVLPSMEGFQTDVEEKLRRVQDELRIRIVPDVDKAEWDADIDRAAPKEKKVRVRPDVDQGEFSHDGETAAGYFAETFRRRLQVALSNLPDAKVDVDARQFEEQLTRIRAEMAKLGDARIGVNISAEEAMAKATALEAELLAIGRASQSVQLKVDVAQAQGALAAFRGEVERTVASLSGDGERAAGSFVDNFRRRLEAAAGTLPELRISADSSPADHKIADVRAEMLALGAQRIGIDISVDDALRKFAQLEAELEVLRAGAGNNVELKFNVSQALAGLRAFREELARTTADAGDEGDRAAGRFAATFRARLESALKALPNIDIHANSTEAEVEIAKIRAELADLGDKRIGLHITDAEALAQLRVLEDRLRALPDDKTARIHVDAVGAILEMAAVRTEADRLDSSLRKVDNGAAQASAGMGAFTQSSLQGSTIAILAGAATGALGTALAAVVPLALGAGVAAGAVVLGMNGIKQAAQSSALQLGSLKDAVSGTFQQGMLPVFRDLNVLLPAVATNLQGTASGLAGLAQGASGALSSTVGINNLNGLLVTFNSSLAAGRPIMADFISSLLSLGNAAGPAVFGGLTSGIAAFQHEFSSLLALSASTGILQKGVDGLMQALNAIIGLIPPLIQLQIVMSAAFGPAIASILQILGPLLLGLAQALQVLTPLTAGLAQAFSALPGPLQTALAVMVAFRIASAVMGKSSQDAGNAVKGTASAIEGSGNQAQSAAGKKNFLQRAMQGVANTATGVVGGVKGMGEAYSTASGSAERLGVVHGIAAGSMSGLKSAGSGLVSFLGGPWGAAFAGAGVALSLFGAVMQRNAEIQNQVKQGAQEWADQLRQTNGVVSQSMEAQKAASIASDGLFEAGQKVGIGQQQVKDAIIQGGPAFDNLKNKLQENADNSWSAGEGFSQLWYRLGIGDSSMLKTIDMLQKQRDQVVQGKAAWDNMGKALQDTGGSMEFGVVQGQALQNGLRAINDISKSASDQLKGLKEALDALNGGQRTVEDAAQKLNDAMRGLHGPLEAARGSAHNFNTDLLNTNGTINTTTKEGSDLYGSVTKVGDSMRESAKAAFDHAGGLAHLNEATAAADRVTEQTRQDFIRQMVQMGVNADVARALADRYLGFPHEVATTLSLQGAPVALQQLAAVRQALGQTPEKKDIDVGVLDQAAIDQLNQLGIRVHLLPNGHVAVDVNDQAGRDKLSAFIAFSNAQRGQPTIDANPVLAYQVLGILDGKVNTTHGNISIGAETIQAEGKRQDVKLRVDTTTGLMSIDGNISKADQQRLGIQAKTDGTTGTMWINGNPVKCDGALNGAKFRVDAATGVMTIDGNPGLADGARRDFQGRVVNPPEGAPQAPIDANDTRARGTLQRLWDWFVGLFSVPVPVSVNPINVPPTASTATGGLVGLDRAGLPMVIKGYAGGGAVAASDTVPTMLTPGEIVFSRPAVDAVGAPALLALHAALRGDVTGGAVGATGIRAMAFGGLVQGLATGGTVQQPQAGASGPQAPGQAPVDPTQLAAATTATAALQAALASLASVGLQPLTAGMLALNQTALIPYTQQVTQQLTPAQLAWQQNTVNLLHPAMLLMQNTILTQLNPALIAQQGQLNLTSATQNILSATTAGANANISGTTLAMQGATGGAMAGVQASLGQTGAVWGGTAGSVAGSNAGIVGSAQAMSAGSIGALNATGAAVVGLGQVYAQQAAFIGAAWGGIQEATAGPARYVTNVVFHNVADAWNATAGVLAMPAINASAGNFAGGGVFPGYAPGVDSVPGMFSPGEGIAVPEFVNALGGPKKFMELNDYFSGGRAGTVVSPSNKRNKDQRNRFAGGGFAMPDLNMMMQLFADPAGYYRTVLEPTDASVAQFPFNGLIQGYENIAIPDESDAMGKKAQAAIEALMAAGGGGNWAPQMSQALIMNGQPLSDLDVGLAQIQFESSGNPTAVNLTDSNAAAGTPSVGLLQVIGPTYASHSGPFRNTGPFLFGTSVNPLANLYAGTNWAVSSYGDLRSVWGHNHGYDSGGWLAPGTSTVYNNTGAPEAVLTQTQWSDIQAAALGRGGAQTHNEVTVNAPQGATPDEFVRSAMFELRHAGKGVHA